MPERRLTAIVAADVVGYSRLMAADEAGTHAALKAHLAELIQPRVATHGGHVIKTAGDGLLVEFASIVEAVACAVEIQAGMAERNRDVPPARALVFRIGVNIGDVIVDDNDVFGDGVNLAARLEQIAEPGGICLSDAAARQVRGKIAAMVEAGGSRRLKNLPGSVPVFRIAPSGGGKMRRPAVRRHLAWAAVGLLAVLVVALGAWLARGRLETPAPTTASRSLPVVVVLPFANQTGDAEQEYLAEGVTDELISSIGRFNTLRVIGRNASLAFKGRAHAPSEIAGELGAQYLVEGSIQRDDRRVRIAARLTDARSGTVLWTEQHDGALTDLLDFQQASAREIASKLAVNIDDIELRRRVAQPKPDPDAYDLVLRARALDAATSRQANREVRRLAKQAIDKDPSYAAAHALLAEAIIARVILGWAEFADRDLSDSEASARRAIAIAPDEPDGHRALGRLLGLRGDYDEASAELRRAIEINPSDTAALARWGQQLSINGDLAGGIEMLERAMRYDPALDAVYFFDLSISYYLLHRYEAALRVVARGAARFPDFVMFDVAGAAAAARLGRKAEAEHYAQGIHNRLPNFDFRELGSRYRDPALGDDIREGLRLAGIDTERHPTPR